MRDETLLADIVEYARHIRESVANVDREAFDRNFILQMAVAHMEQIIGEAARQLSEDGRKRFPAIPWTQVVGMRHRLVHEYFRLELKYVWDTATNDIPELLKVLEPIFGPILDARKPKDELL